MDIVYYLVLLLATLLISSYENEINMIKISSLYLFLNDTSYNSRQTQLNAH